MKMAKASQADLPMPMDELKKCPKCSIEKPKVCFGISRGRKDGIQTYCKMCRREMSKNARRINGEKLNEVRRQKRLMKNPRFAKLLDQMESALLWTLYHHQGGSSHIGQPIRKLLGIGQHERMTDDQIAKAKAFGGVA